jgi:AcrR family transcriptional regulator
MRAQRREAILDAAGDLMQSRGWGKTRVADVANLAGVSRTTLYAEFGTRENLAQEALLRETRRLLVPFEVGFAAHPEDAQVALEFAFDSFVLAVIENPLARALLLDDNNEEILALITIHGAPVLEVVRTALAGYLCATWTSADPAGADLLAECLGRVAISVATLPGRDPYLSGARVATLLGPFARALTGTAP